MSTINDTDLFLVQRGQDSYKQSAVDLMSTILDTDYMLIQRGTDSFKVTCEDVKDQLGGGGTVAPVLDSVVLSQNAPIDANRFTSKSFTSTTTNSGGDATTLEMTGTVTGALGIKAGSDPITTNAYPGTSSTDVVLTLSGTTNLGDVIQVGDTVTANLSYTPETDTILTVEDADIRYLGDWVGATVKTGSVWDENNDVEKMFDGTNTPYAPGGQDEYATLTFDPPVPITSLAVRSLTSNQNTEAYFVLNGIDYGEDTKSWPVGSGITNTTATWSTVANPPAVLSTLAIGWKASWGNCAGIRVNGTELLQGVPLDVVTGNRRLTLPSEKDIALFQVDDIVQADRYVDGSPFVYGTSGLGAVDRTLNLEVIPGTSFFTGITTPNDVAAEGITYFYDANGTEYSTWTAPGYFRSAGSTPISNATAWTVPVGFVSPVTRLVFSNNASSTGRGTIGFSYDGTTIETAADVKAPVKVTAADVSARTITVDGGSWDTSNQSQVWSENLYSGTTTYDSSTTTKNFQTKASLAFDGDDLTITYEDGGSNWIYFRPNSAITVASKVEFGARNTVEIKINGDNKTYTGGTSDWSVTMRSVDFSGQLTEFAIRDLDNLGSTGLSAIKIDGRSLVDKVNDSQDWSTSGTIVGNPYNTDYTFANMFNGISGNANGQCAFPANDSTYQYTFPGNGLTVTTSVSIEYWSNGGELKTNYGESDEQTLVDTSSTFTTVTYTAAQIPVLKNIALINGSAEGPYVSGIRVDGVLLLDPGIRNIGDSKASTTSAKQGSGTVSDITGAQVTVTPFTDNCFKEGQWLTVNKTINVDPKTDKITSYDDTTKVITVDGDTDLLQFSVGDSVFMTDNSGSGASTKTGYKLTTTDIDSVSTGPTYTPATTGLTTPENIYKKGTADRSLWQDAGDTNLTETTGISFSVLKVDVSDFGGHSVEVTVEGVTLSATTNPDNSLKTLEFNFGATTTTQPITINAPGGGGFYVYAVYADDDQLIDGATTLTFPGAASTNPDLKYFKPNDIVGNTGVSFTYTGATAPTVKGDPFSTPTNDGGANSVIVYTPATTTSITYTFPTAININAVANQIGGGSYSVDFGFTLTWIDQNGNEFTSAEATTNGGYSYQTFPVAAPSLVRSFRITGNDGSAFTGFYQNGTGVDVGSLGVDVKAVSVDTINNKMTVDGGDWLGSDGSGTAGGETKVEFQTTGGVGTIAAGGVNITNKTITLTAAEVGAARWIADNKAGTEFRVATAQKPAVATTAYLKFSADGSVTGYQATPVDPRVMDNKTNPKLTFPATFPDTGQAPDAEFPDPNAYIETSVQLKNAVGDSEVVASNQLVPQTNIRSIGSGEVENNADDVRAMAGQIATHDQRVADHTAAMRQQAIADFEANLRRYSS